MSSSAIPDEQIILGWEEEVNRLQSEVTRLEAERNRFLRQRDALQSDVTQLEEELEETRELVRAMQREFVAIIKCATWIKRYSWMEDE